MKLHVIMGQREGRYEREYGMEALAVMTEYDADDNGEYLPKDLKKHRDSGEFSSVEIITMDVNEADINNVLFPQSASIVATVTSSGTNQE